MPMTQEAEDELTGRTEQPAPKVSDGDDTRARFPAEDDSEWRGKDLDTFHMGHLRFYFMPGTSEGHPGLEVYGEAHWEAYLADGQWFLKFTFNMEDSRIPHGDQYYTRTFPFPEVAPLAVGPNDVRRLMHDHTWESQGRMLRDFFAIATSNEFYRKLYPIGSRLVLDGTSID